MPPFSWLAFCSAVVQPWPSLARWPRWPVPSYLFLDSFQCDVLYLALCDRVVYPHYLFSQDILSFTSRRPRKSGRAHVGLCDISLRCPGGSCHNPDTLAASGSDERGPANLVVDARIIPFEAALLSPDREPS
jgi:hypothetical protein